MFRLLLGCQRDAVSRGATAAATCERTHGTTALAAASGTGQLANLDPRAGGWVRWGRTGSDRGQTGSPAHLCRVCHITGGDTSVYGLLFWFAVCFACFSFYNRFFFFYVKKSEKKILRIHCNFFFFLQSMCADKQRVVVCLVRKPKNKFARKFERLNCLLPADAAGRGAE